MKLYKAIDEESAREFIRSRKLYVEPCDDSGGMISFQREICPSCQCCVVLEFDMDDVSTLYPSRNGWMLELAYPQVTAPSGLKLTYVLNDDIKLTSISIFAGCKMDWQFVRLCLDNTGRSDVVVKDCKELS